MTSPARAADRAGLQHSLERAVSGEVRFDPYSRALYSTDASIYRIEPIGVVLPRNADDVQAVIEVCHRDGVWVLPRGGGTSLSGQTVNDGLGFLWNPGLSPSSRLATYRRSLCAERITIPV